MRPLLWLAVCWLMIGGCQNRDAVSRYPPQDAAIQAYFNHRQDVNYSDPYRQIERAGDNLEAIIIEEIENAQSSVDIAVQELNLPLIAQALVAKNQSGVPVRLILDNNYSRVLSSLNQSEIQRLSQRDRLKYQQFLDLADLNRDRLLSKTELAQTDALYMLQQAGVPVIDDTADGSKGSGLMHHKFMVIDKHKVVTASANFTISGIHGDIGAPQTLGNVNHLLVIKSDRLADLFTEEFNYMWGDDQGNSPRFGLDKPQRNRAIVTLDNSSLSVQFSPTSDRQTWDSSVNGLIGKTVAEAQSSVDLALFVFSEQKIANILQTKQQQGIKIRGVFDSGFAWRYYSEVLDLLGTSLYRQNKRQGDRCQAESGNNPWDQALDSVGVAQLNSGDKLHHKFAIIDRDTVLTGSHNWSNAANRHNDETLIVLNNSTVAQYFQLEFEHLYRSASLGLSSQVSERIQLQRQKCN